MFFLFLFNCIIFTPRFLLDYIRKHASYFVLSIFFLFLLPFKHHHLYSLSLLVFGHNFYAQSIKKPIFSFFVVSTFLLSIIVSHGLFNYSLFNYFLAFDLCFYKELFYLQVSIGFFQHF